MSAKQIPASCLLTCDGCNHTIEASGGDHGEEACRIQFREHGGSTIRIQAKGLKEQGHPISERIFDLCGRCWPIVQERIKSGIKHCRSEVKSDDPKTA